MRVHVVAKWRRNESLPPQASTFKRVSFQVLGRERERTGLRYLLDDLSSRGWRIPEVAIDLATLATTMYAADMGVSRSTAQDSWTREILLDVPVSQPALWEAQRGTLTTLLNYLTGDRWFFRFRARDPLPEYNNDLDVSQCTEAPKSISLFSGGLDSCVGAIDALSRGDSLLCISHAGDSFTSRVQTAVLDALNAEYEDKLDHLRIWYTPRSLLKNHSSEKTTRGRSFLFFAVGAVAAATHFGGTDKVELLIPENGFISLNVPLDPLRLGAHSTRTTHPFVLRLWNEFLSHLGLGVALRNPYQFDTKGEMFQKCADKTLLQAVLPATMSCSSPTKARWKKRKSQHCGHCVPCIIRRAAVKKAFGTDPTNYTVPLTGTLDPTTSDGRNVRAFQRAIHVNAEPRTASIIVHSSGPLERDARFGDLYVRGLREVNLVVSKVTTRPG